jgi:hypothetical protein
MNEQVGSRPFSASSRNWLVEKKFVANRSASRRAWITPVSE